MTTHPPSNSPTPLVPNSSHAPSPTVTVDAHAHLAEKKILPLTRDVRGRVITVSDAAFEGAREDLSGPLAQQILAKYRVVADRDIVPDGVEPVRAAIRQAINSGARVIVTSGGTGVTPRDLTPEATMPLLEVRLDAIAQQIVTYGLTKTPLASLSRGLVGITQRGPHGCLVVNAPGSRGGVRDALAVVGPLIAHILEQFDPEQFPLPSRQQ